MAANIASNLATWSTTAASNQPDSTDAADIVADLQQIQATVRKYLRTIGADIASASTTDLANATGDYVSITGTTTITALGNLSAGMRFILSFAGALTLTHNATSLILPGASNITTAAGDVAWMESLGSGNWKCLAYTSANGYLEKNALFFSDYYADLATFLTAYNATSVNDQDVGNAGTVMAIPHKVLINNGFEAAITNTVAGHKLNALQVLTETPDTTPLDGNDSRVAISATAIARGSQHASAMRGNLSNYSDDGNGCTGLYGNAVSDVGANWSAGTHGECRHGGGTSIGVSAEAASYETTGTMYGVVVNNSTYGAETTHPITSGEKAECANAIGVSITGRADEGDTYGWAYGLNITSTSMRTDGTAIQNNSSSAYGLRFSGNNSVADMSLEGDSAYGLNCGGTYTNAAIKLANDQYIAWTTLNTHKSRYSVSDTEWQWESNGTVRIAFNATDAPHLKFNGVKVLGDQRPAIANATDAASAITQLNLLLATLRTHGLIAT